MMGKPANRSELNGDSRAPYFYAYFYYFTTVCPVAREDQA
jgi:hypothetical protein